MMKRAEFYDKKFEALRQKEMAEKMIQTGDYGSARNKLLAAQDFGPLDHIVPMLTVCEVLSASTFHISGSQIDHYMILRLVPSSSPEDIALQHKKLLTLLKPIKESFSGTELALQFIQEAFLVLSDRDKRAAFDLRRNTLWEAYESSSIPPGNNKIGTADGVSSKSQKDSSESSEKRFELNLSAKEDAPCSEVGFVKFPILKDGPSSSSPKVVYQDLYNFDDDRNIGNMEEGQIWATHYQSNDHHQNPRYVQIMTKSISTLTVMRLKPFPVSDRERRWIEAGLPVGCGSFSLDLGSGEMLCSPMELSHKCTWTPGLTLEQFSIYPRRGEVWAIYEDRNLERWSRNPENIKSCKYKLIEILSDFTKYFGSDCACLEKVEGFRRVFQRQKQGGIPGCIIHVSPSMLYLLSHKVPAIRLTGKEIDGVDSKMLELDHLALPNCIIKRTADDTNTSVGKPHKVMISKTENSNAFQVGEVQDKTPLLNGLKAGQVWAIYCGKDSMPRQYVLIDKVISRTQVRITLLEPETKTEMEINWKGKNLPITCGTFGVGRTTVNLETSQLSHLVRFEKTASSYKIYPAKGEIWAMYGRWNSNWESSHQENCEYWILQILSDLSEEEKIRVARLKEVKGCLTFFRRLQADGGFSLISDISKTEILSFSHRIPFCRVPGIRNHGIPEDCFHLEPNDLPPKSRV